MWSLLLGLLVLGTPWDPPEAVVNPHPDLAAPAPDAEWRDLYRIVKYDPGGAPCLAARGDPATVSRRIRFKRPFFVTEEVDGWLRTGVDGATCWVEREQTSRFHERTVLCPIGERAPQRFVPLADLVDADPAHVPRHPGGIRWPTFYMIAREELYPLRTDETTVAVRDRRGKVLARTSPGFRRAAMYQGTARLADGRLINVDAVTKKWGRTFRVYGKGVMGAGIQGYRVYPYRSAALDFDDLCDALGGAGCTPTPKTRERSKARKARTRANRKALAGSLLHVPRLEGIPLPDGSVHDGYVCAVDVGGGIKGPRMDLFVGWEGGGNPYYPACRNSNALLRGGIETLVPWDWHRWEWKDGDGAWQRAERDEFIRNAPGKGLEVQIVAGVRCRQVAR
ncbi:MAG: hypothetical protein ABIK09_05360 [Pseudomonadota bacterium]